MCPTTLQLSQIHINTCGVSSGMLATKSWPFRAAQDNAVEPWLSLVLMSTPTSMVLRTVASIPFSAAHNSAEPLELYTLYQYRYGLMTAYNLLFVWDKQFMSHSLPRKAATVRKSSGGKWTRDIMKDFEGTQSTGSNSVKVTRDCSNTLSSHLGSGQDIHPTPLSELELGRYVSVWG